MKVHSASRVILLTVFLNSVSFGIIIPVLPQLLIELGHINVVEASLWGGGLSFAYAGAAFLFAPIVGNLSDRIGRRPVLLFSIAALAVNYLILGLAPSITWLIAGRILAGISASCHGVAAAWISDTTAKHLRSKAFGTIGAAWGVGFVCGPAIGGMLGSFDLRLPFFIAAVMVCLNFQAAWWALPETLRPEHRSPFRWRRANLIGACHELRHSPQTIIFLCVIICYQLAYNANPQAWSYYAILKFGWTGKEIGFSLMAFGLLVALNAGFLIRPIVRRIGEHRATCVGLLLGAMGFIGFAFAANQWMLVAFILPWSFLALIMPSLRALLSNALGEERQGALHGAISSAQSLTMMASPLVMSQLFYQFSSPVSPLFFPGAPFLAASALLLLSLGLLHFTGRRQKQLH